MQSHPVSRATQAGFTLIELMVVVVVATILLAVAIPSYQSQIRKSRRVDAKTAVLDAAGREERFFSTNGSLYSQLPADLGYAAFGAVGSGYYNLGVVSPAANPIGASPAAPSFTVTATAFGTQAKDTQCASFAVDSTGKEFAVDSGGADQSAYCWAN